jgi:hypothetical protein
MARITNLLKLSLLCISLLYFNACDRADDGEPEENVNSECDDVTGLKVEQSGTNVIISWDGNENADQYEISYVDHNSGTAAENGTKFNVEGSNSVNKSFSELRISYGDYNFFIRALCPEKESEWSLPYTAVLVEPGGGNKCVKPNELEMVEIYSYGPALTWETNNSPTPSRYEVQYGESGFSIGSGTTITTPKNEALNFSMKKNTSYDFYVRDYCQGNNGWSDWSEAHSYYATKNNRLCEKPTGLVVIENFSVGGITQIQLGWENYGNVKFEYVIVEYWESVNDGTIKSVDLTNNGWPIEEVDALYDYDLYVRTVCEDGSKTAWAGPYNFET